MEATVKVFGSIRFRTTYLAVIHIHFKEHHIGILVTEGMEEGLDHFARSTPRSREVHHDKLVSRGGQGLLKSFLALDQLHHFGCCGEGATRVSAEPDGNGSKAPNGACNRVRRPPSLYRNRAERSRAGRTGTRGGDALPASRVRQGAWAGRA